MAFDRTLVQIRERNYLDVLDLTLQVIRDRPVTLGLAALGGIAPFALLNAWLVASESIQAGPLLMLLVLEVPWATAPLTVVLGGLMFGERPTFWQVVRRLARAFLPMVLFQVVLRGLLLISVVFYPVVPTRMAFIDEILLLERGRLGSVLRRSSQLCEDRGGNLFGQWLAQLLYASLFTLGFWLGTGAIVQALFSSEVTWEIQTINLLDGRLQFALWVAIAFFGAARFLSYIDQRIRLEGWEVELRVRAAGRLLEDARRW